MYDLNAALFRLSQRLRRASPGMRHVTNGISCMVHKVFISLYNGLFKMVSLKPFRIKNSIEIFSFLNMK